MAPAPAWRLLGTTLLLLLHRATGQECASCLHGGCAQSSCSTNLDTLFIGGLFAMDPLDLDGGQENKAHFDMAIDMLNDKNDGVYSEARPVCRTDHSASSQLMIDCAPTALDLKGTVRPDAGWYDDLLPETQIAATVVDSKCDAQHAAAGVWELADWPRHHGHELNAIVGPACSGATNAAMYMSSAMELPTVSYSATSKTLSGRDPYFFRTCAPDNAKATRLVDYMRRAVPKLSLISMSQEQDQNQVEWHRVGVVTTTKAYAESMASDFSSAWRADSQNNQVEVFHKVEFDTDEAKREANVDEMLHALAASRVRVVVITGHTHDVEEIMRLVDKLNVASTATDTVWFTTTDSIPDLSSLATLRDGFFSIVHKQPDTNESAVYAAEWLDQRRTDADNDWRTLDDFGWNVHDAVVAIATAADRMIRGLETNHSNQTALVPSAQQAPFVWNETATPLEVRRELQKELQKTDLRGISGHVRFDHLHDRAAPLFTMNNLQNGHMVPVADVQEETESWVTLPGVRVIFPGATEVVPPDYDHPSDFLWIVEILGTGLVAGAVYYWWKRRQFRHKNAQLNGALEETRQELEAMSKQLASTMTGMYKVIHDVDPNSYSPSGPASKSTSKNPALKALKPPPILTGMIKKKKGGGQKEQTKGKDEVAACANPLSKDDVDSPELWNTVQWCWEEDSDKISNHNPQMVISGTSFIHYAQSVNNELEEAYQLFKLKGKSAAKCTVDLNNRIASTGTEQKAANADSGSVFHIDFRAMAQTNAKTNFERKVYRHETKDEQTDTVIDIPEDTPMAFLPPLPPDVEFSGETGQSVLYARRGQIIQVSKDHSSGLWLYGNILHDPSGGAAGKSGWFPRLIVQAATSADMQVLAQGMGRNSVDALATPWTVDPAQPVTNKARMVEVKDPDEKRKVKRSFMKTLNSSVVVTKIERIENIPMWQSYAVKKQTTISRDTMPDHHRHNNHGKLERKWLFHGTSEQTIPLIIQQGFNRAFAGKNAVAYGKGVYFARDASYSSHPTYSRPDKKGVQRMFMCRVVVGDWCKGNNGALTPDTKPKSLELFDTTVDTVHKPSIFVAYHDAQAYPEYLISFKQ